MDLGDWLGSLGLEGYEAAFRANAIDADVLGDLTDQDLQKDGRLAWPSPQALAGDCRDRGRTYADSRRTPHTYS
jgi:SAM domain (Sterile alpha motif)